MDPQGQLSNYLVGVLHNYWFSTSQADAARHQACAIPEAQACKQWAKAGTTVTGDSSPPMAVNDTAHSPGTTQGGDSFKTLHTLPLLKICYCKSLWCVCVENGKFP